MHRPLLRFAILVLAAPLLLGGCKDNADPVKPRVNPPPAFQPGA
jgi:hypothetical protein